MSIGNGSTDCAAESILFEKKEFESASYYIDLRVIADCVEEPKIVPSTRNGK